MLTSNTTILNFAPFLSPQSPFLIELYSHDDINEPSYFDMHYAYEIGIVMSGSMRRFLSGLERDFEPGEVWCSGVWEPHGYTILKAPCEVIVILIWPPLLMQLRMEEANDIDWTAPLTCPPEIRPVLEPSSRTHVLRMGRKIHDQAAGKTPFQKARIRVLIMDLLLSLVEAMPTQYHTGRVDNYSTITPALELVAQSRNFIGNVQAADACAMSVSSFTRQFQALMGISFAKFAMRYRLSCAAHALLLTSTSLDAIATQWGFTDASHFSRMFTAHYGCTPTTYRNTARPT